MPDLHRRTKRLLAELQSMSLTTAHYAVRLMPTDFFYRDTLTDNLKAYYDLWKETLHKNNCVGTCKEACLEGAQRLTDSRKECIRRGQPDLHPSVEEKVFMRAFRLHEDKIDNEDPKHGNGHKGSICPTWSETKSGVCNCFELAMAEMGATPEMRNIASPPLRVVNPEEAWYEPRIE